MISYLLGGGRSTQSYLEDPAHPLDDAAEAIDTSRTDSGVPVTRERILGHPAVWSCVSRISRTIAMLPLDIYQRNGDDLAVDKQHPLHRILTMRPDVELSPFALIQKIVHDYLLGNSYTYVWRDGSGQPVGLWPLNAEATCPVRVGSRLYFGTVLPITNEVRRLDAASVIHCRGLSFDAVEGYDVVQTLRNAFALGLGQRKFRGIYFKNNGRPNVTVEAPAELSDEARDRLIVSWRKAASGLDNAHKAVLLEEGAKVHEFGSSARDSQLLDGEEHELTQIANIFCVPPSRVGAKTNVSYKSLEQDNRLYFADAILPVCCVVEQEMNAKLLSRSERAADSHLVQFDRNEFDWSPMAERFTAYNVGIQGGWLNRDEVRRFESLNPIPGGAGAEYLVPLNMGAAADLTAGDEEAGDDADPIDPADQQKAADDAEEQEEKDAAKTKARKEGSNDRASRSARHPGSLESSRLQAVRDIFARDVARMLGRVATAAARTAKADASGFTASLDRLEADHGRTVREAIGPPARAMGLQDLSVVEGFFGFVRRDLLEISGHVTSGEALAAEIGDWAGHLRANPAALAEAIQWKLE